MIRFLKRYFPVLFEETMPVWLTIIASIAAAGLTYVFAPTFNRQFQVEDIRSAHLQRATDQLNQDTIDLSLKIRRLNVALVNNHRDAITIREDALDQITRLQWRLVDLDVLLTSADERQTLASFSENLKELKTALDQPYSRQYAPEIKAKMSATSDAITKVLGKLYAKASLKEVE